MKKLFSFIMLGAMALVGATTFNSCSSDEAAPVNPTFDGESVKTTFTISVGDVKGGTRMAENAVQLNNTFQGMTDIYLFPAKAAIADATVASEGYINLPDFDAFNATVENAHGKIYKDVTLSVGVNNFLFYAATKATNKDNGELKPSYLAQDKATFGGDADWAATQLTSTSTIGGITFDLVPYQKDKGLAEVKADANAIANIKVLNDVDAALTQAITDATTANSTDATTTPATIVNDLTDLQNTLRNDFDPAGSHNYKEYAGSSASMKWLMEKLYNALKNTEPSLTSTTTTPVDYAKPMLDIIADGSSAAFTAAGNATDGYTLTWNSDPNFPTALNLPDGAIALKYNGTDKFEYVEAAVEGVLMTAIGNYTHPARLYYTINTPSMVKDAEYLETNDNTTNNTWEKVKAAGSYAEGAIKATTRSVIMKDEVQYAVGRLDVQARVKNGVTIKDNGSGIAGSVDENPQPVAVPTAGYTITGVLIGGQKQVDWQFKPAGSTTYTIWDGNMVNTASAVQGDAYSALNYTLALETEANTAVKVALEFVNTGKDFYGVNHNIIPAGSKFYLIATLTPGTNEAANPNTKNQVFLQDYITTAKFTINETSLSKAYNVIPDLRSPKLEFGLSVNLEWQAGITFEQEF